MENEVYNAAIGGNVTLFRNSLSSNDNNGHNFLNKTSQNNNIIHVAAQHDQNDFIDHVLSSLPKQTCESLISDKNCYGNTPLHIAAEFGNEAAVGRLTEGWTSHGQLFPWRVVNSVGNTVAHVALLHGNVALAVYMLEKDSGLARLVNNSKETLLHLAIRYYVHDVCRTRENHESLIWPIINVLLSIDSSVTCWADNDGSTPLHMATSLAPDYRLPVIKAMLASCPQAAEVLEPCSGQSMLHLLANHKLPSYEGGVELMNVPQVYALRNCKNNDGDTPLHIAARTHDTVMVQVLLGFDPKLGIRNKSGVSATSLLQQLDEIRITAETRRKLTKEEHEAAKGANMVYLNKKLGSLGMNFLASQPPNGGNLLHTLVTCRFNKDNVNEVEEFIGQAITKYPLLINQKDCKGDTPVHVLAQKVHSQRLLDLSSKCFQKAREEADDARRELYCLPWRLKNAKGDTPLHVAVRARHHYTAIKLVEFDEEVGAYVNNRNETPLHLLCQSEKVNYEQEFHYGRQVEGLLSCLINGNGDLAYMQDEDGLTPLLVAIKARYHWMIRRIQELSPESSKIVDKKGRTLWHMFVYRPLDEKFPSYYDIESESSQFSFLIDGENRFLNLSLMTSKDDDGNTPLHLAIANRHFDFALLFIDNGSINRGFLEDKRLALLATENNAGVSSHDLIGSTQHLPPEFEKSLLKKGNLLFGHRSFYGVPTTKIESYANTIGVTAALLATITFTAAFTVPGGLNPASGAPLLLQNTAFQMFMVSDVIAMCSSVMVLFCLLWIMTTSHKRESLLLLDVSVLLLQTSFLATLTTFMTGLYVTTIHIVPAIAIFTLVTCSFLMLIMHKGLVMLSVVPCCAIFIIWSRVLKEFLSNRIRYLWSLINPSFRRSF
ncbi:hypothetical protein vseg_004000 [Gypsophila vaccaria]